MTSQNIYEYKKVTQLPIITGPGKESFFANAATKMFYDKINELIIEQNHLMKDFELYKKAFKTHISGGLMPKDGKFDMHGDLTSRSPCAY